MVEAKFKWKMQNRKKAKDVGRRNEVKISQISNLRYLPPVNQAVRKAFGKAGAPKGPVP